MSKDLFCNENSIDSSFYLKIRMNILTAVNSTARIFAEINLKLLTFITDNMNEMITLTVEKFVFWYFFYNLCNAQ